tara:strand:+ start:40 stop:294 length:255 start_codon:yes stop_codon:yes gene_type:complete
MFQYNDLKDKINEKQTLQIITKDFNGGLCRMIELTENYIHIGPLHSPDKENFGSVNQEILLPLELITVILIIDLRELKETEDGK